MTNIEQCWYQIKKEIIYLHGRVGVLEAEMNEIITGLNLDTKMLKSRNEDFENLRQQDEDVERVAGDPQPIATDEELAACSANAAKVAILERRDHDKALTSAGITKVQSRAVYDLGRQHGAAANSKSTPNFAQIRSSAPVVGLRKMLARVRNEGSSLRGYAATDVIIVVADWLELQQEVPIGSTASADYFAAMLREEANQ